MIPSTALLVLSAALPTALAWGAYGHYTIAYIATNFVESATKTYFQKLLNDTSTDYLATVASWADTYRETSAGRWSAPLHFIDAMDNPPSSCNVKLSRDCGSDGCVVSAIANYTSQLLKTSLSATERGTAAKFIIHFVGDIGQPLHCENLDEGGNDVDVTYNGDKTNLHAIWDTQIPEAIGGGTTKAKAKTWAATLTTGEFTDSPYKNLEGRVADGDLK